MKQSLARQMFDHIAPTYDALNRVLTVGIDKLWRQRMVKTLLRFDHAQVLDLATGTGDVAVALARKGCDVTGVDPSEKMLAVARKKGAGLPIKFTQGFAEKLDFPDASFDAVTIAFGIRNFENRETALHEILRVLRPNGKLIILEFSPVKNPLIRFHTVRIIPTVGRVISRNRGAYVYLPTSIAGFPNAQKFKSELRQAGFRHALSHTQIFAITQLYVAYK